MENNQQVANGSDASEVSPVGPPGQMRTKKRQMMEKFGIAVRPSQLDMNSSTERAFE